MTTEVVRFYELCAFPSLFTLNERTVYFACPDCMKKLMPDFNGEALKCEKCDKVISNPVPSYILNLKLNDCTSSLFGTCFREDATAFLGLNPQDFSEKFSVIEDENDLRDYFSDRLYKQYKILVKAQLNEYNDESSIRYRFMRVVPS